MSSILDAGAAHQCRFQAQRFSLPPGFAGTFNEILGFSNDIPPLFDSVGAQQGIGEERPA